MWIVSQKKKDKGKTSASMSPITKTIFELLNLFFLEEMPEMDSKTYNYGFLSILLT